jgi:hypothetical protein
MDNLSPLGDSSKELSNFKANFSLLVFLQDTVVGLILSIDFPRKFKVKVVPETSHILFACTVATSSVPPRLPSFLPEAVLLFARPTSS